MVIHKFILIELFVIDLIIVLSMYNVDTCLRLLLLRKSNNTIQRVAYT